MLSAGPPGTELDGLHDPRPRRFLPVLCPLIIIYCTEHLHSATVHSGDYTILRTQSTYCKVLHLLAALRCSPDIRESCDHVRSWLDRYILCRTYLDIPAGPQPSAAHTEISGPSLIIAPVIFPSLLSLSVFARLQSCCWIIMDS